MSGHYGYELRAGIASTYGTPKRQKPPTAPTPSSTPIAKPIPKPVPKGAKSND